MALPPLVDVDELVGLTIETDPNRLAYAVLAASAYLRSYTGMDFVDDAGQLTEVPDAVHVVAVALAKRVCEAPDDAVTQETAGPFSRSMSAGLWLSRADREMLADYRVENNASISPTPLLPNPGPSTFFAVVGRPDADRIELRTDEAAPAADPATDPAINPPGPPASGGR